MIYDLAVVGAGAWGLGLARAAVNAGRSVALLDRGAIGCSGASAGLLGALMPASAVRLGPLGQVQLTCLTRYADRIARLEGESGLATHYRRAGRLQPLRTRTDRKAAEAAVEPSRTLWRDLPGEPLRLPDHAAVAEQHPQLGPALYGWAEDTVTAQVQPRALLTALTHCVTGRATLFPHTPVLQVRPGEVVTADQTIRARRIAITAGWRSGGLAEVNVAGVKGHAAATAPVLADAPLLYARDAYVIFHAGATAIGSTTEPNWRDTRVDDGTCALLQQRAAALMPQLVIQPLTECWAGLRPKTPGGLPLVRQVADGVIVATGGYKVGLALCFELADWLLAALDDAKGDDSALENFWSFVAARENLQLSQHA